MPSTADISSSIINALALTDPELDTTIGTPLRKIIDAVAQQQSQGSIDSYLINYQYDVDSKSGGDLDDFVATYGIARLQATRATGVITLSRSTDIAATRSTLVAPGTQAAVLSSPPIYVQTTVTASLSIGQLSIDVPAQAVVAGPSGNVPTSSVQSLVSAVDGVSAVNNAAAFTGGTNAETDAQLRARFKSTVFKNLAGTDSMYRGVALQTLADPTDTTSLAVNQVNILGSTKHSTEQLTYAGSITASSLTSSAYNYGTSVFLAPTSAPTNFLVQGTQYTVTVNNGTSPATLSITSVGSALTSGVSYNLDYDYVPIASRNDPFGTRWNTGVVNNRVDIYVNGLNANLTPTQSVVFVNSNTFVATAGAALQNTRFVTLAGANPAVGDIFVPLAYGPITSMSASSFTLSGHTYTLGVDYDIVHQNDAFGYTPTSAFGLVWYAAALAGNTLANNSVFPLTYNYNQVPSLVADNLANWRLLGTDVQVHAGRIKWMAINVAVMYTSGFTSGSVNPNITSAVNDLIQNVGFGSALQVSDIINVIHNVNGVDNVRLLNSNDNSTRYAILEVNASNSTILHTYSAQISGTGVFRPIDVAFNDNEYPQLAAINIVSKTANNFGPS